MFLRSINKRNLSEPITIRNIRKILDSIHGLSDDDISVMNKFGEFEYRIRRFKGRLKSYENQVDPFFVNHMKEPIENVKLEYKFKKIKTKNNTKNNVEQNNASAPVKTNQPSVSDWL